MMPRSLATSLALLLTVALVAPSAFLIAPQKARATEPVVVVEDVSSTNVGSFLKNTITAIKSTLTEVHAATSAAADVAQWVNMAVLQPIAFVLSGNLMKALTAGVIAFVIGKANGTGAPQFVGDVMASLQTVSDSQALAYLNQFGRNSNSPFAYSISSSLRINYLQKTTLAGFWAANRSTLPQYSPNVNAFLAGDWSQGGIASWFALTTQTQNNPYTLYQASQAQMSTLVGSGAGGATGARIAQLNWGQGFMSWCGAREGTTEDNDGTAMDETTTEDRDGTGMEGGGGGVNPGDPCTNRDGTPGTIKTPGSTIKATLDKVLGGNQDQIVRMGNVGPQINQILANIGTVLQTVQFASQILGGPGSGGLFGVDDSSVSNPTSRLMQYQNTPGYLGVTNSTVYQGAAALPVSGAEMSDRIAQYESAWNTISAAATVASTSVASVITYCNAQALQVMAFGGIDVTPQVTAAQTALATKIAPVFARAATAATTIAAAKAMVQKVQSELSSGADAAGSAFSTDMLALQSMPPTMSDVANIQQEAQAFVGVVASPPGSLNVSGGSLIDQMNLITTNAEALKLSCSEVSNDINAGAGGG